MSTKLESLVAFESKSINKMEMSKIRGGYDAGTETGAGTWCCPTSMSASGCMAYSSDTVFSDGRQAGFSPTNGTAANSDVELPC